jgi:hypothetical protein
MIDSTRKYLLKLIEELSVACTDYRFRQLVLNVAFVARDDWDRLAWSLKDAEFVHAARKHLADWYATRGTSRNAPRSNSVLIHA